MLLDYINKALLQAFSAAFIRVSATNTGGKYRREIQEGNVGRKCRREILYFKYRREIQ